MDKLPSNIPHLTLGYDFYHFIAHLPPNITHLTLGHEFNQSKGKVIINGSYFYIK